MILWICPNGSMGFQIFVSADPGVIAARPRLLMLSNKGRIALHHRSEAQAYDLSKNGADIPRPTMRNSLCWFSGTVNRPSGKPH